MAGRGLIDRALRVGEGRKFKEFQQRVDVINRFEPEMELLDDDDLESDDFELPPADFDLFESSDLDLPESSSDFELPPPPAAAPPEPPDFEPLSSPPFKQESSPLPTGPA